MAQKTLERIDLSRRTSTKIFTETPLGVNTYVDANGDYFKNENLDTDEN